MSTRVRFGGASKRRRRRRRACVAVLTAVAAFAALQLGLAVGVETCLPGLRDPVYAAKLEHIRRRRAAPDRPAVVVMLGSSRTQSGFRTRNEVKTWATDVGRPVAAFNLGVTGGGPLTELLLWRRLRRDGVRPDLLLIEVLPPVLAGQVPSNDFAEVHWPTERLEWQDLPLVERYAGADRAGLRRDWLTTAALPWYSRRANLMSLVWADLLPQERRQEGAPGEPPVAAEERSRATEMAHGQYVRSLTGFRLGGLACAALGELVASCRRDGVPAALVLMPEGPTFRSWYAPETWKTIETWLTRLSRDYDTPLLNAREWCGEDHFHDSHHLTAAGAAQFTERLGQECVVPLLRGATMAR